ncbi:pyridoxine/pyridoxamine 5'-phosphate oxidase [Kibdelosporangium aridum]|uniref:Pyridoxamine 5'-phosphate oxidase n=1 Tax=Kibdelosporangium aridum TaxID=2030 RepID=A0A1W2BNF2_KIBAR|nr:pyridoxal 5'-phosphate synthase [Kibdelosporangium aridum]SMC74396.1 pyridoxamine 5'-phosphate oxidase [Kibdelosporangium aridum]
MSLVTNSIRSTLRGLPSLAAPLPAFDTSQAPANPAALFQSWLENAIDAGLREPHAMTLSTVDAHGRPDARTLILKDLTGAVWWFATHSLSPKGTQLTATPYAALTFYWPTLGRQIRVRGAVITASSADSARDFLERSESARTVAALGNQSKPLANAEERRTVLSRTEPPPECPEWTLYGVVGQEVEFWQGDPGRDHTRLRYTSTDDEWERTLLWP